MKNNPAKAHAPTDQPSSFTGLFTRPLARYALAVGVAVAAFLARYLLADLFGPRAAYVTFYPAVMVAAVLGGFWPGILATGLSGLLAAVWILPPVGQLKIENTADIIGLAMFLGMGVFMSAVASLYRGARERVVAYEKAQAVREAEERFREAASTRPAGSGPARPFPRPPEAMRVFKQRLAFDVGLALTLALLMTVGLLSYRNMTTAVKADRWATHTYAVAYELGDLLSALGDVESSQRGYLITGDKSYLDQYAKARGRVDVHLNFLRRQTADNPRQQQRFATIGRLLEERLALIKDILDLRVTKGFEAASAALMTSRGQQLMDDLRQLVDESRQEEAQLLQERGVEKESSTARTIHSVVLGAALGSSVLVAVFILLKLEFARRQRVEQELRVHQDHLTELVDLRTAELRREREALRESEERLRELSRRLTYHVENSPLAVIEWGPDMRLTRWSGEAERIFGWKAAEVLGKRTEDFRWIYTEDTPQVTEVSGSLQTGATPRRFSANRNYRKDGSVVHCEWYNSSLLDDSGKLSSILSLVLDVTERKLRETELQKLNRTLKALSNSNQAMLHATDEAAYLQDVCRIIAEDCGHVMVWVGLAQEDAGRTVRPVAHAGFDEGYLEGLKVTWADTARGRGPTGTAIRTGKTVRCTDMLKDPALAPWREEALKRGYASSLAVPLIAENQTLGAITIYSRQTDPFTAEELTLLTELASDVSYGLMALRLRAAHARAELAAREREEELVAIYENAPLIMLLVDEERHIHKANKETERFVGVSVADLLGRSVGDALHCPYARDDPRGCGFGPHCRNCALRQTINHTIETGRSHHELEVAFSTTTGGKQRDNTFLLSTLRLTVRGQSLALATMQNITRRKQAEEALRRAHAELELRVAERTAQLRALAAQLTQSEERERRRIAQILHDDLQQLLVAARLRLEAIRGRKDSSPLDQDLQRVQQLINESNDLARGLSHEISPAVLHEFGLVAGLQWLGRWMREKHGFSVRVAAPVPVGVLAQDVQVLLFQSVRELLFNAVKHSDVKRASVRLSLIEGGWLEIQVSDKGRGFDPSQDSTTGAGSAGFGLFSIRERLAYLGGHMEVASAPGQGCQVRLRVLPSEASEGRSAAPVDDLPSGRQRADQKSATAPGKGAAQEDTPRPPAKIRVLLADDHRTMRDGLATFLEQQPGIEVVGTAADGQEAIDLAAQLQPDVVIMDVGMPRLDGIEATRQIRSAWPHVQVIGLTMHADDSNHAAMRTAGAVDCLIKSGPTEDLLHAIRTARSAPARTV